MKYTAILRTDRQMADAIAKVTQARRQDRLHRVRIEEYDPHRTQDQNALMWAWCRAAAKDSGYTADQIKQAACAELIGMDIYELAGKTWTMPHGTSSLGKQAFAEFLDQLAPWLVEHFNIELE